MVNSGFSMSSAATCLLQLRQLLLQVLLPRQAVPLVSFGLDALLTLANCLSYALGLLAMGVSSCSCARLFIFY